jgi:hypothetical protein
MFQALKLPAYWEHPVARHALGALEEGRWSRSRGALPTFCFALGGVGLLIIARHLFMPRVLGVPGAIPLYYGFILLGLILAMLPLAFWAGFWVGWRETGRLARDNRFRDLFLASGSGGDTADALRTGLTGQALVYPVVYHQALFLYLWRDEFFAGYGLSGFFLLLIMTTVLLAAAGPALDYGLALGMRLSLKQSPAPMAVVSATGHFAAATGVMAVGLGVFGLMYLHARAMAEGEGIAAGVGEIFEDRDDSAEDAE